MRLLVVGSVLLCLVAFTLSDTAEETTDINQEEDEYEDIAVAESQDIAHSRLHSAGNGEGGVERPRPRPRGRKRRRRLRKRPRSTTPSFIEEYDPERTIKEEETAPTEEEVVYQRRRPSKRRRRPIKRKPEHEAETTVSEVSSKDPNEDWSPQEHYRPRNSLRRRRKNGRKRMRVTTESTAEFSNNTQEDVGEITTQPPEVVMQLNNFTYEQGIPSEASPSIYQEETTPSTLSSAFTPKEITEINHKLESLTEYQHPLEDDYQVSGLGAFSIVHTTNDDPTTKNVDENHVITSSTTAKDYAWISRFDPRSAIKTTTEAIRTLETKIKEDQAFEIKKEAPQNIKNIEKIIENRKNLFSTSRRLPPTSAVIRRRLRPRKHRNSTTTQETITDNTIPTINPTHLRTEKKICQSVECALNMTSLLSNHIVPSALLPSGFPTMPEILSTAEIIRKMSKEQNTEESTKTELTENTDTEIPSIANTRPNLIIITPSTLIRSPTGEENSLPQDNKSEIRIFSELKEPTETGMQSDVLTPTEVGTKPGEPTEVETKPEETTISSTETTTSLKNEDTTVLTTGETNSTANFIKEMKGNITSKDLPSESEKLKLDGVDVSNINDQILELIMDDMGKARVKRILELRNMTLSELIAHRERGAGHFSTFDHNSSQNQTTEETNITETSKTKKEKIYVSKEEIIDEEKTEEMIVEKAKHFLSEYKKGDDLFPTVLKHSQKEIGKFGQRLKVEGTVIPVPILEPTHTSSIQFPEDGVLGAFPKYMYDIAGKRSKSSQPPSKEKPSLFTELLNRPRDIEHFNDNREPRVFESMPKFSSEASDKDNLEISPYPDWRITVSKSTTEKSVGFPGISKEIMFVATSKSKSTDLDDVFLLDEGEEVHHLRNHILGGNINVESRDIADEDYPEEKKVPAAVKSAIAASGALLGLAIFGFLAVLVSCKIRQRRARLRVRRDILNEHLAEDFRSSQRSLTPVLRKSPFNHNIHSNTASSRHYYLWRTLRKTFQYE